MYGDGGAGGRGEVGKASLKTSEDGDEDNSAGMIVTTMMISVTVIAIMLVAVLASRRQPVR